MLTILTNVLTNMNDIIFFSNSIEDNYTDLTKIVNILLEASMKISLEKSKFFLQETSFLGYVVSYNVIKTDPEKIAAIQKYPIPKNVRELSSFLGLTSYYRKFFRNYAYIAKPLTTYDQEAIMEKYQKICPKKCQYS